MTKKEAIDILAVEYIFDSDRMEQAKKIAIECIQESINKEDKEESNKNDEL